LNRIVLKVGTSTITNRGCLDLEKMKNIVKLIYDLQNKYEVILVSSGAVGLGYKQLNLDKNIIENKQVLATIGQPILMANYKREFRQYDILVGQLLLTMSDFNSRKRSNYALRTINLMLKNKVIPIINENDTTDISELFGDNDQLSAYVCHYFKASLLVLLSDIDGYYDANPHKNKNAKIIKTIYKIDENQLKENPSANNEFATGGILTKLLAGKFLLDKKHNMFLSSGLLLDDVRSFLIDDNHIGGSLFQGSD